MSSFHAIPLGHPDDAETRAFAGTGENRTGGMGRIFPSTVKEMPMASKH